MMTEDSPMMTEGGIIEEGSEIISPGGGMCKGGA